MREENHCVDIVKKRINELEKEIEKDKESLVNCKHISESGAYKRSIMSKDKQLKYNEWLLTQLYH